MQDKMIKMLMSKKKEGKTLSDSEKKSKLHALQGMRDMAHQMMGDKLKNLKKVTVASDSKEGLKAGLHKAEDLADQSDDENQIGQDPNMYGGGSAYAQGGKVGQMPPEFDRDEDHVNEEHDKDAMARAFNEGGEAEESESGEEEESPEHEASESPEFEAGEEEEAHEESLEKIMSDSPNDPDKIEELIKMLKDKKKSLES